MVLPNPAYTDAAHKNGVRSLGVIGYPKNESYTYLLQQDKNGKFPIADKLLEMMKYYGFDGWFINEEDPQIATSDIPLYKAFMKQLREGGAYVQWYDAINASNGLRSYQNELNSTNSPFIKEGNEQYASSIFLNYWWNKAKLTNSAAYAISLRLDPLSTIFFGIEGGMYRWNQPYDIAYNKDANGQPMNGIAIIGADMPGDVGKDVNGNNLDKYKDENQWKIAERERIWWSGPSEDPTNTGRNNLTRSDLGIKNSNWDGVADQIVEKSVISGTNFHTNFNTGHGLKYYLNGQVSNDHEWNNIIIQDILPTWQWWIDSAGTKLKADFDYGTGYERGTQQSYTAVDPYRGGSSLVISGKLDSENFLHLYKTSLDVNANSKVSLTFKKTSSDAASMKLGLIFKDKPDEVVPVEIPNTTAASENWVTSEVDLSAYQGRNIAAFGLLFDGSSEMYQMHVGEIRIQDGSAAKPAVPTGLKIDKAYTSGEMTISWNLDNDYNKVKQYNVYATVNGKEMYMGGTYDQVFYIKNLYDPKGDVAIRLTAVGADGTESDAASAVYRYDESGIPDVKVTPENGKLNINYDGGDADITVTTQYEETPRVWKATGTNGSAVVAVAKDGDADGADYAMSIKKADGTVLNYDGHLDDNYCTELYRI